MDCNLGSEIGQKMRSAVKAKLLELGTGGSAGFIDDELPDYVMVMVANKRTKQQMNAELNLFLGDQTDLFVTWLHEVLQKLQEVTLPVASASNKKSRKSRLSETTASKVAVVKEKEKDKKLSKKDRRPSHRKSIGDEQHDGGSAGTAGSSEAMATVISGGGSITDVFAEELLEKAKKSLDADHTAKDEIILNKKKNNKRKSGEGQDFDIPTISEISSTTSAPNTTAGNREKDLAELAAIQKKIEAAKKHLRKIGEIDVDSDDDEEADEAAEEEMEDEQPQEEKGEVAKLKTIEAESGVHDDDLLNLNAHEESSLESSLKEASIQRKAKSPIVFNRRERSPREATPPGKDERQEQRRSVHDRLGSKAKPETSSSVPDRERSQRTQKELYVPAHRRRSEPETRSQRERSRSRSHDRRPSRNDNPRESIRSSARQRRSSPSPEMSHGKQRIGSRVIVAVHKSPEPSDDEDLLEKPVNSVIKIKPRPHVSPRRQASKNLLLRAVAEAQRSTILAKSVTTSSAGSKLTAPRHKDADDLEVISSTLGKRKLIEKSIESRDKIRGSKRSIASANNELFRRCTRDLVVNVMGKRKKRSEVEQQQDPNEEEKDDVEHKVIEEYVPSESNEKINFEAYVPEHIDMHISSHSAAKTQFVVTLNGEHSYRKGTKASSPQVPQIASCMEPTVSSSSSRRLKSGRGRSSSPSPTSSNKPPPSSHMSSRSLNRSEVIRQSQEIKKIIIKNNIDTDEDDELHHRSPKKNGHKDINKSTKSHTEERSTTPPLPVRSKTSRPEKRATSSSSNKDQKPSQSSGSGSGSVETTGHPVNSHNEVIPSQVKAKHTPIRFTLKPDTEPEHKKRRSRSVEQEVAIERRKIPIRHTEDRKYDNLPTLSAVSVDSAVLKVSSKQQQQLPAKERCKYHPNCTKQFCEYYHPTAPCKTFPNCKFADKCMYSHPKCKYDMSCMSIDCNFAHSGIRDLSHGHQLMAPPLSSHVIPVQNYKSISAPVTTTTATTMCKFYPNCTKVGCTFHHPKLCRFGKNCVNKLECVFYHPEMQSKFKWVASMG